MDCIYIETLLDQARFRLGRQQQKHNPIKDQLVPQNVLGALEHGFDIIQHDGRLEKIPRFLRKVERVARQNHVGVSWLFKQIMD
jgi:hypothetical protein